MDNHVLREENAQLKGRVHELETQVCWLVCAVAGRWNTNTIPLYSSLSSAILTLAKVFSLATTATSEHTTHLLLPEARFAPLSLCRVPSPCPCNIATSQLPLHFCTSSLTNVFCPRSQTTRD